MTLNLVNGTLEVPDNFVILNPEEAPECKSVAVIECMNSEEFNIPHFVLFHKHDTAAEITEEETARMYELATKAWEDFAIIVKINEAKDIITNADKKEKYHSDANLIKLPLVGIFHIFDDEANLPFEPAYGMVIHRSK